MQHGHGPAACVFEAKTLSFILFMFQNNKAMVACSYRHCSLWPREKKEKNLKLVLSKQVDPLVKANIK